MHIVVFGLTVTSAWGNGHATLWRGLCRALHAQGHRVTFFERDVSYYARHRDFAAVPWCEIVLYDDWTNVRHDAAETLARAEAGIVTSFCPDGLDASNVVLESRARKIFYDLDSPVTLDRLSRGELVPYLPNDGLSGFDVVLSFAGGPTLEQMRSRLGARRVLPLYGSVDPAIHHPLAHTTPEFDLSYLGTYAADRQDALEELFIEPARRRPDLRFALAGSQYPGSFPWTDNIYYRSHLPPADHPAFFCSSRLTLNITRGPMAVSGFCPSGRLFEAAACGTPIVSDAWPGIEEFFEPAKEILTATTADAMLEVLERSDADLERLAAAARDRALTCHSAPVRARELVDILEQTSTVCSDRQVVA